MNKDIATAISTTIEEIGTRIDRYNAELTSKTNEIAVEVVNVRKLKSKSDTEVLRLCELVREANKRIKTLEQVISDLAAKNKELEHRIRAIETRPHAK